MNKEEGVEEEMTDGEEGQARSFRFRCKSDVWAAHCHGVADSR